MKNDPQKGVPLSSKLSFNENIFDNKNLICFSDFKPCNEYEHHRLPISPQPMKHHHDWPAFQLVSCEREKSDLFILIKCANKKSNNFAHENS